MHVYQCANNPKRSITSESLLTGFYLARVILCEKCSKRHQCDGEPIKINEEDTEHE